MAEILVLDQDVADLPGRDVDADILKLPGDQGLRYMPMVMPVQDKIARQWCKRVDSTMKEP